MKKYSFKFIFSFSVLLLILACSQEKLSDRDLKKQQQENQAQVKRQELETISGLYLGVLLGENDYEQKIELTLEVKEVPESKEGSVDPVLIPKLLGFLVFKMDETEDLGKAAIQKSEYRDPKMHLTFTHSQFKELIMDLESSQNRLTGTWSAPEQGLTGTVELERK